MDRNPSDDDRLEDYVGVPPTELDLNAVDREILAEIAENGRATLGVLDEEIDASKPYISGRAGRLEEHGLLKKRVTVYELTELGNWVYDCRIARPRGDISMKHKE